MRNGRADRRSGVDMHGADDVVERPHLSTVRVAGQLEIDTVLDGLRHLNRLMSEQDGRA